MPVHEGGRWRFRLVFGVLLALSCPGGHGLAEPRRQPAGGVAPRQGRGALSGSIVFQSNRDGRSRIYRIDLPGTTVRRLMPGSAWDDEGPVWSPDGTHIAFASNRAELGRTGFDIHMADADGAGVVRLTDDPSDEREPCWAADGRSVFFSGERNGRSEIYRVWLGTKNVERVTHNLVARAVLPAASPDGRHLAYATQALTYQIQLLDLKTGQTRPLTSGGGACRPRWSPDGRRVAYVEHDGPTSAVWAITVATDERRRVFADPTFWSYDPAWSPDGSRMVIAVSRLSGQGADWDLAVLDLAAPGPPTRLTGGAGDDRLPDWK